MSTSHIKEIDPRTYVDTKKRKILHISNIDDATTLAAKLKALNKIDSTIQIPSISNLLTTRNKKKCSFIVYEYDFIGSLTFNEETNTYGIISFPYPEINTAIVKSLLKRYLLSIRTKIGDYVSDECGNPTSVVKFSSIADEDVNFYQPTSLTDGMTKDQINNFYEVLKEKWNSFLPILMWGREKEKYFSLLNIIHSNIYFSPEEIYSFILPDKDSIALEEDGIFTKTSPSQNFNGLIRGCYYFLFEDGGVVSTEVKKLFLSFVSIREFERKYFSLLNVLEELEKEEKSLSEKIDLFEKIFSLFRRDKDFPTFSKEGWCMYFDSPLDNNRYKEKNYFYLLSHPKMFVDILEDFFIEECDKSSFFREIIPSTRLERKEELLSFFEKLPFSKRLPLRKEMLLSLVRYTPSNEVEEITLSDDDEVSSGGELSSLFENERCAFPESIFSDEEESREFYFYIKEKILKMSYIY